MQSEDSLYDVQNSDVAEQCDEEEPQDELENHEDQDYMKGHGSRDPVPTADDRKRSCTLDMDCVEIEQCQVRPGCLRTLMMQVGACDDTKRFDVVEQTATEDGFAYVSTVFADVQKAIEFLRDYKNSDTAKTKRKHSEMDSKKAEQTTNKVARATTKRCLNMNTLHPNCRINTKTHTKSPACLQSHSQKNPALDSFRTTLHAKQGCG